MLSCDEAMTAYLRDVSSKTNLDFYGKATYFIILYRDCLNQYGWEKLAESEVRECRLQPDESNIQKRLILHKDMMLKHEYATVNNAEVVPEICNEFITIYLESHKNLT